MTIDPRDTIRIRAAGITMAHDAEAAAGAPEGVSLPWRVVGAAVGLWVAYLIAVQIYVTFQG